MYIKHQENNHNIHDCVLTSVVGLHKGKIFFKLRNGELVFSHFQGLVPGDLVLCSLQRKISGKWKVSIDTILNRDRIHVD